MTELSDPASGRSDARPAPRFREGLKGWAMRHALGVVYVLMPNRLKDTPALVVETAYRLVAPGSKVPDASSIWRAPDGYGGPMHDPSAQGLLDGMRAGFYQSSHIWPLKWWSPSERAVMMLKDVHIAKRFRRTMRNSPYRVTIDEAFPEVLVACAAPRRSLHLTWLHPRVQRMLQGLFEMGYAHSVEVWDEKNELVGAVFGVQTGPVFSALSMFHTANDASKLAIISLYHHLDAWGLPVVDHQVIRPWVESLGAKLIPRAEFDALLAQPAHAVHAQPGRWMAQFTTAQTADWQPSGAGSTRDAA